jgi:hypothetical protein
MPTAGLILLLSVKCAHGLEHEMHNKTAVVAEGVIDVVLSDSIASKTSSKKKSISKKNALEHYHSCHASSDG